MPWFKVDDNLAFHHKVVAAGNPALGLWVRAGSLCAQQLTDGFIPDHMIPALGTVAQAKKLVLVGLWDRAQGGYTFHGWDERQPSKASVEAERAAAQERMRAYRAKKKGMSPKESPQVDDVRAEDVQPNERGTNGEVREMFGNPDPTHPDPTHPVPTTSSNEEAGETPRADVRRICDYLAAAIFENGSLEPTVTKSWLDAARLMLDKDKRTEAEVIKAIDWCQRGETDRARFWRPNVMSMPKLREKFDTMRLQAAEETRKAPQTNVQGWMQLANDIAERDGNVMPFRAIGGSS